MSVVIPSPKKSKHADGFVAELRSRYSPIQEHAEFFENAHYDDDENDENCLITRSMVEEEERLQNDTQKEEENLIKQAGEQESLTKTERYQQLHQLLSKSKIYAQFLLQKIEKQTTFIANDSEGGQASSLEESQAPSNNPDKTRKRKHEQVDDAQNTKRIQRKKEHNDIVNAQPRLLTGGTLRQYQLHGFEWMKILYENGINGILADEMGLGKTIQCIALLAHLIDMGVGGPYLICAPLSTLFNWVAEFKQFTPKIPVILYHGSIKERCELRKQLRCVHSINETKIYPVVVTSYEIVIRDRKALNFKWKYVIIDEGHRIKNFKCLLFRELKRYHSVNRLLLTGTPLQNNLSELWSLLNFLLPEIFDNLEVFESWFDVRKFGDTGSDEMIVAQEQESHLVATLHEILSPFLLRRMKSDVELFIPPKKELLVYAPFTDLQEKYYRMIVDKTILELGNMNRSEENDVKPFQGDQEFQPQTRCKTLMARERKPIVQESNKGHELSEIHINVKNSLMPLRKCCNHPYLLSYPFDSQTNDYLINEDLICHSGKMILLDAMLPKLKKQGHKVLLFSQMTRMLDILQDYCYYRGYQFSRLDGKMNLAERNVNIESFNKERSVFVFLLSTRAGGLGLNLVAADTVIIYDSDWNPQCDLQAMDRCHRIGQTKPVVIYRFVTANTIDQKIVERAASKRKLEKMIIYKGKFKCVASSLKSVIEPNELLKLLKSADHDEVVMFGKSKNPYTDTILNSILDRSDMYNKEQKNNASNSDEPNNYFRIISDESSTDILKMSPVKTK